MNINLPGSAKLHVYLGLILALIGFFVGGYAYTGDRVYHIENIAIAFGGFALLIAGSVLAGIGQSNRPRLGGNPRNKEDKPSLVERVKGLWGSDDEEEARPVDATLECADCGHVFDVHGTPPVQAVCPNCGNEQTVDIPNPRLEA